MSPYYNDPFTNFDDDYDTITEGIGDYDDIMALNHLIIEKKPLPEKIQAGLPPAIDLEIENPLITWIKYRPGEAIPESLLYKGYRSSECYENGDLYTPLRFWIDYRPGERIPELLYYKKADRKHLRMSYRTDTLMQWLWMRPLETLPKVISYPGWLQDAIYRLAHGGTKGKRVAEARHQFIHKYIKPSMEKYKAMLDTHEFVDKRRDGEELYYGPCDLRCECCNDRMDPTEEPEDVVHVRDRDNIHFTELCWYHLYHYDDYTNIQQLLRNPLKVDYSAMEQFIQLAN